MSKQTAKQVASKSSDQSGKNFLVTGAYTGLGDQTVRALLSVGAQVIVGCRNQLRMEQWINQVIQEEDVDEQLLVGYPLDLGDFQSIADFAAVVKENHPVIDVSGYDCAF
eukprot:TRINITY_DN4727_c0_g1_i1.p1 TRINITY_DN4727_c0_g1~~TRINITY_DN4727_c0_g1_i1.p1  ORF type:complete len:110 (-),score=23.79 TRINITY_DN4727_c0_g1_i1:75-404(-)